MRMRLKSNLDFRVEKNKEFLIEVDKSEKNAAIAMLHAEYIDTKSIFGNGNPLYLDLGSGKGSFSIEHGKRFKDVNIIGVEMITNVILSALEKMTEERLSNVRFLNTGADYLLKYFPAGSVDRIYLNFSTPKQKKSYRNSRLTSPRFLQMYDIVLKKGGELIQKTDDDDFFEYSLEQLSLFGFEIAEVTKDLHALPNPENIITEYEEQFISIGKKIKKIVAVKK